MLQRLMESLVRFNLRFRMALLSIVSNAALASARPRLSMPVQLAQRLRGSTSMRLTTAAIRVASRATPLNFPSIGAIAGCPSRLPGGLPLKTRKPISTSVRQRPFRSDYTKRSRPTLPGWRDWPSARAVAPLFKIAPPARYGAMSGALRGRQPGSPATLPLGTGSHDHRRDPAYAIAIQTGRAWRLGQPTPRREISRPQVRRDNLDFESLRMCHSATRLAVMGHRRIFHKSHARPKSTDYQAVMQMDVCATNSPVSAKPNLHQRRCALTHRRWQAPARAVLITRYG